MIDETEDKEVEATPVVKTKRNWGKPILLAAVIMAQVAIAFALAHFVILPRLPAQDASLEDVSEAEPKSEDGAPQRGTIIMMDDVVVNLMDENGSHFLKVATGLEYSESKLEQEIADRMPELRALLIDHFASSTVKEVVSREGRDKVKQEILNDFNSRLTAGQLLNIYFSDFVVQ